MWCTSRTTCSDTPRIDQRRGRLTTLIAQCDPRVEVAAVDSRGAGGGAGAAVAGAAGAGAGGAAAAGANGGRTASFRGLFAG